MLQKNPKPGYRRFLIKGAKILFVVEAALFFTSYGVWHRMNTNRDFRYYLHNNLPWVLESYYKFGETLDSRNNIRQIDFTVWRSEKKLADGLGYFLMKALTPDESTFRSELLSNDPNKIKESKNKQELFALILKGDSEKLKQHSSDSPIDTKPATVKQN